MILYVVQTPARIWKRACIYLDVAGHSETQLSPLSSVPHLSLNITSNLLNPFWFEIYQYFPFIIASTEAIKSLSPFRLHYISGSEPC